MNKLLHLLVVTGIAVVCAAGCGSVTLVHDGGTDAGGNSTGGNGGQGGVAGHAPTGTAGTTGVGGKVGTGGGGGASGMAGATGSGGSGGVAGGTTGTTGSGGSGGVAGGTTGTTGVAGAMAGASGAGGGGAGGSGTGGAGTGGAAGSAGGSCGSQVGVSCGTTCNPGTYTCSNGSAVCTNQVKKSAGSSCGTNMFCDSSANCNACTPNASCGTTCAPGTYSCTTGMPVCNQSNASLGTSCGSNLICNGSGGCVSKTADGGSCSSNVVCQNGNCSTYSVSGASICCPAGNSNCGGCVNEQTDSANCGACGSKCAANRSCQSGACACQGYTLPSSCGGCGSWSFESGTAEGWTKDTDPNFPVNGGGTNGATNFVASTAQKHDGTYALAVPVLVDATTPYLGATAVPLCGNGSTVALGGFTMSAWVMIHSNAGSSLDPLSFLMFSAWGSSGAVNQPALSGTNITLTDIWYHVSVTFSTAVQADHVGVYISSNQWAGTIYIDSVTLTGP